MPPKLLFALSKLMALPFYPILIGLYKPANEIRALRPVARKLFYNDFCYLLARRGFTSTAAQIFDQLSAPIANFLSRPELEKWVAQAGLKDVEFYWRNRNCWNFVGVK